MLMVWAYVCWVASSPPRCFQPFAFSLCFLPPLTHCPLTCPPCLQVIVAPRSNNLLDTERISGEFPELLGIRESLIK